MTLRPVKYISAGVLALSSFLTAPGALVVHYPFEPDASGRVREVVTGQTFDVDGQFGAESAPGVRGRALYLDGYTSYVGMRARDCNVGQKATVVLWVAVQSYPIVKVDDPNPGSQTCIVDCIDHANRRGFGYFIGFDGQYSFQAYVGGELAVVNVPRPLPRYRWNCLVAEIDGAEGKLRLYNNYTHGDAPVAEGSCARGDFRLGDNTMHVGQNSWEVWLGDPVNAPADAFRTTAFGGLLDELEVHDCCIPLDQLAAMRADNPPVLAAPAERYDPEDRWRPRFHGQPSAGWTNETHGLVHYDGRWHLFFQKNAAGPYMARLHWGHLTSDNLLEWTEERIAVAPGETMTADNALFDADMKGCWSGCVYTDGGRPEALYTAVDYGRARIFGASPVDNSLISWTKNLSPLIDGRPDGLSDDFRDPYFFRADGQPYIIVGSQADGRSAVTLHRLENGTWTRHSRDFFFYGGDTGTDGVFAEMPSVTRLPDGRWLFVYSPIGTSVGARTLYRIGTIDGQGHWQNVGGYDAPRAFDLFGRDGFGLMSPSIVNHDGRVIALGIVPDKVASCENKAMGWAHCYSLPRELSVDADGNMWQRAARETDDLYADRHFSRSNTTLSGVMPTGNVSGRRVRVRGAVTPDGKPFGIRFFKNPANPEHSHAALTFDPEAHTVSVSLRHLPRIVNDGYPYDGLYTATLPDDIAPGRELVFDLIIDHSVIDLFVNDRYAASVRVFPHDYDGTAVEAFAEGTAAIRTFDAWTAAGRSNSSATGHPLPPVDRSNRMAILIPEYDVAALNAQERAAVELFRSLYPDGAVLTPGDLGRLTTENYGVVWIHIDRRGTGGAVPGTLASDAALSALKGFVSDGGSLYLTKHATRLVSAIGRIDPAYAPGICGDGDGGNGTDVWTLQARIGLDKAGTDEYYDRSGHPIYAGLATWPAHSPFGSYDSETFAMLGTGNGTPMHREDHNSCWDLNAYGNIYTAGGRNTVERFQNQLGATVLGTWGHVKDYAVAAVVEFHPRALGRSAGQPGIILANGLAAYELSPRMGDNAYQGNIERLTANSLAYLGTFDDRHDTTGVDAPGENGKSRIFAAGNRRVGYSGLEPGTVMTLCGIDGRVICRKRLADTDGALSVDYTGVVIVSAGATSARLLLR